MRVSTRPKRLGNSSENRCGHGQEGSQGIVARRRTWGWSRIWDEKLALVRTCHSRRPAPELATAGDCSALARMRRIAHGHAAVRKGRMAAAGV